MAKRTLDRILQSQGFGTRKACATAVRRGLVRVDGEVVREPRAEYELDGLVVSFDGVAWVCVARCYLALHKPAGVECSRKPSHHPSVMGLLPEHLVTRGVQPVGRLDQDTTGLLLLTDDGAFNHAMSSPKRHVPKRYRVTTADRVEEGFLHRLVGGVQLHGETGRTAAKACERVGERQFDMTIEQGKYHQVKRMVAAAGNSCVALHRAAVGGLELRSLQLAPGEHRQLSAAQMAKLRGALGAGE